MSQNTIFGTASLVTYIKVEKKDGRILYYEVKDGENIEITEVAYLAATTGGK